MSEIIAVDKVSKRFTLKHNRADSIKSLFVGFLFRGLRETQEEFWALRDVSLSIKRGESVGLIGPNGAGKSTLLYVIARTIEPTAGSVRVRGSVAPMIELGLGFHPDLSGRENLYLNAALYGLSRREIDSIVPDVIEFSELGNFVDSPVSSYSSGMQARLAFSIAVNLNTEILLIDEVLAVGDDHFQKKCMARMKEFRKQGRTLVFVSHSMGNVLEICDRACVLSHGGLIADCEAGRRNKGIREAVESLSNWQIK